MALVRLGGKMTHWPIITIWMPWGFMIQAGEQCCMLVPADLRDPVLWQLLKVGTQQKQVLILFTDNFLRWESLTGRDMMFVLTR